MKKSGYIFSLLLLMVLAGCKAEIVEIRLTDEQLYSAVKGQGSEARFTAEFSTIGKLDDESRQKIRRIEGILAANFDDVETELEKSSIGYKFIVSGVLPVTSDPKSVNTPWFVAVSSARGFGPYDYLLQVRTSRTFEKFKDKIKVLSFLLSPQAAQPIKFKIKASGLKLIAPAVQVDGESFLLHKMDITGRESLVFKGGVYESIGAGFVFKGQPDSM